MNRFHFSVRGLLVFVAYVAVGCAAFFNASPLWASACFTVASILLLAAIVGAICRRGRAQAFWLGFAVVGHGYALLAGTGAGFDTPISLMTGLLNTDREGHRLVTTRLLDWTYEKLYPAAAVGTGVGFMSVDDIGFSTPEPLDYPEPDVAAPDYPSYETFSCIGESLWTMLFACFGGLLGRYFHAKQSSAKPQADS